MCKEFELTKFGDGIVLEQKNLQMTTPFVQILYANDFLLVES